MTNDTRSLDVARSILERECRDGRASLSPPEVDIFCVYRFLTEFENGGLSGLLYNLSPDADELSRRDILPFADLHRLSCVVRELGRGELAALLDSAFEIASTGPHDFQGTWSGWLALTDPDERLPAIDERISGCYHALWDDLPLLTRRLA